MKCDEIRINLRRRGFVVDFIKDPVVRSPFEGEPVFKEIKLRLELNTKEYINLIYILIAAIPERLWKTFKESKIVQSKIVQEQRRIWKEYEDAIK